MNETILDGIERIRTKYPQAHVLENEPHESLLIIPGVLLGKGWNKTICTVLTSIPHGFPHVQPNDFWVDLPDLMANGKIPKRSFISSEQLMELPLPFESYKSWINSPIGYPEWNGQVIKFLWRLQAWSPNNDGLYTWLSAIKQRLSHAR